jgi:hypothetical protein
VDPRRLLQGSGRGRCHVGVAALAWLLAYCRFRAVVVVCSSLLLSGGGRGWLFGGVAVVVGGRCVRSLVEEDDKR